MWLFENLKARILKRIITWSEMGQQTTQAKEVYWWLIQLSTLSHKFIIQQQQYLERCIFKEHWCKLNLKDQGIW